MWAQRLQKHLQMPRDTELIEQTLGNLSRQPGVLGVLISNSEGVPIRTTLEPALAVQYAGLGLGVATVARRAVKQLGHAKHQTDAVVAAAAAAAASPRSNGNTKAAKTAGEERTEVLIWVVMPCKH